MTANIRIVDLKPLGEKEKQQVAEIVFEAFKENSPEAWPTIEDARAEVEDSFGEARISRVALDENGEPVGWIGGLGDVYDHAWELHPLAVKPGLQGQGIGSLLTRDFETQVRALGIRTIFLGSDDENNTTSLGGIDLYPDVLEKAKQVKNLRRHPFEFYQKMGYVIVGLIPDANGFGKPDIMMAKRLD
jgi:aminoglycoside 6'-N-acetyltransferase I